MISKGVPFDVAHAMEPDEALAYAIAFGENDGGKWDMERMTWIAPT